MPSLPEVLIARHIEKLRARPDTAEKIPHVLTQAGLTVAGEHVTRNGRPAIPEDCRAYKRAVRDVYGEATYAFTKVNFVLGGCECPDCAK